MKTALIRQAAALAATLALALPASAATFGSTDYTDLWWVGESESGWGMNLIQQSDKIFLTFFVYGNDNRATWFVAPDTTVASNGQSASGVLYQTTGPAFSAGTFDRAAVNSVPVGNVNLAFTSDTTATLTYSVNGIFVTKNIQRESWRTDSLAGSWAGGLTARSSNCSGVANGTIFPFQFLTVQQSGAQTTMRVDWVTPTGQNSSCTFLGDYSQAGRLGRMQGTWNCTTSNTGSFTISNISTSPTGWSGTFSGSDQYCTYNGQFGGIRDVL